MKENIKKGIWCAVIVFLMWSVASCCEVVNKNNEVNPEYTKENLFSIIVNCTEN